MVYGHAPTCVKQKKLARLVKLVELCETLKLVKPVKQFLATVLTMWRWEE